MDPIRYTWSLLKQPVINKKYIKLILIKKDTPHVRVDLGKQPHNMVYRVNLHSVDCLGLPIFELGQNKTANDSLRSEYRNVLKNAILILTLNFTVTIQKW